MRRVRKVCVVTGSRAEYGLLYWLLKEIQRDTRLTLQLAVTGMHLSPQFGLTVREIEADGFVPDAKVDMLLSSDTPSGIAKSIGLGVIGFAGAFEQLQPDLLVVLGIGLKSLRPYRRRCVRELRLPIYMGRVDGRGNR